MHRLHPLRICLLAAALPVSAMFACGNGVARGANFQDIYRWSSTVADGMSSQGDPATLRWSIVDDGLAVEGGASGLVSYLDGMYGTAAGSDYSQRPWFEILEAQFENIASKTGLSFEYVDDTGGAWNREPAIGSEADIRIAGVDFVQPGQLGEAERPSRGGDVLLDTDNSTFSNPIYLGSVFQHELGHSLGLLHVSVSGSTPLMTTSAFPLQGPQFDDLYALTRLYGDKFEKLGGNDHPTSATPLGTLAADRSIAVGSDADDLHVAWAETDFATIDSTSDIDYYRVEIPFASEVSISLAPRGPTYNFTPEGLSQQTLAASSLSNLGFRLLARDGVTPLASVDLGGLGADEHLSRFRLPSPGNYYVDVRGEQNLNQFYQLNIQVEESAAAATPSVFRDSFNAPGGVNGELGSSLRQGTSQANSPYGFLNATTLAGEPAVEVRHGKLVLRGVQGAGDADSPSVDLLRNFAPQLAGERWLLSLEVHLEASHSSTDAAFALTVSDSWPAGEPFSNEAKMTVEVSSNNRYRIVEAGANATGEAIRQGSAIGPNYLLQLLVDETLATPEVTVAINGVTLLTRERIEASELERYLGLHVLTGNSLASAASVTAEVDNLSLALVTDQLAGDYNLDGLVNLADYTLWRNQLGRQVLAGSEADGNANGRIDAADYGVWKSNFGLSATSNAIGATVPEPAAWLPLLWGTLLVARSAAGRRVAFRSCADASTTW